MIRHIAIGETSSYRYIGIEPPLTDAQSADIIKNVALPFWISGGIFKVSEEIHNPSHIPHTELGVNVGAAIDTLGAETVDEAIKEIAIEIGRILESEGDISKIEDEILSISYEVPLFGPRADEERTMLTKMNERYLGQNPQR